MKESGIPRGVASMTGYGRAVGDTATGRVTVEIRSLNHRYLDMSVRTPREGMFLDPEIRALVRKSVSRGKVEVFVTLEDRARELTVDRERALEMAQALEQIAQPLGDTVRLEHLLMAGEIFGQGEKEIGEESRGAITATVQKALDHMVQHRLREGASLASDLEARVDGLVGFLEKIVQAAPLVTDRARRAMQDFLDGLNLGEKVDPARLEVEVAIAAQRSDVTEEMTRLATHIDAFRRAVAGGGAIGRRLDFLIQEIQREINTIGSKSGLPEISETVVRFKTDLEKVREQVQNIE